MRELIQTHEKKKIHFDIVYHIMLINTIDVKEILILKQIIIFDSQPKN